MCVFLQVFDLLFFNNKKIHSTTMSGSKSVTESEILYFSLSDSDPAKTYGFFRIRIHNTVRHLHFSEHLVILIKNQEYQGQRLEGRAISSLYLKPSARFTTIFLSVFQITMFFNFPICNHSRVSYYYQMVYIFLNAYVNQGFLLF
jgi:hypothetical protein